MTTVQDIQADDRLPLAHDHLWRRLNRSAYVLLDEYRCEDCGIAWALSVS